MKSDRDCSIRIGSEDHNRQFRGGVGETLIGGNGLGQPPHAVNIRGTRCGDFADP